MAKHSLFGEGKNAVQQTAHIRSSKNFNGGESRKTQIGTHGNPHNEFVGNAPGVLGASVTGQHAPGHDSPVPGHAAKPNLAQRSKASEAGDGMHSPPGDGVLGRG